LSWAIQVDADSNGDDIRRTRNEIRLILAGPSLIWCSAASLMPSQMVTTVQLSDTIPPKVVREGLRDLEIRSSPINIRNQHAKTHLLRGSETLYVASSRAVDELAHKAARMDSLPLHLHNTLPVPQSPPHTYLASTSVDTPPRGTCPHTTACHRLRS
jgi:hypothetical protein